MSCDWNDRIRGGPIEFENVLQLFDILRERGYDLTGRSQSHDAFAEYLTMCMAELPNVASGSAKSMSMILDGIS